MATFHIPAGGYRAVFQGNASVPIADYYEFIHMVMDFSVIPERVFTIGSPFNTDDFTHFVPGIEYFWRAKEPFDIIT